MIYLHEKVDDFTQLIVRVGEDTGIALPIIEKDYYVTMFLREIVQLAPDIIFKGGTSLSKGYGIIKRFSEDIDLNYDNHKSKPTVSMRRRMKDAIISAGNSLGLSFISGDEAKIPYRQDYIEYDFTYSPVFASPSLRSIVKIETSVRSPSFPVEYCMIGSEIQKYLEKIHDEESIKLFGLTPFSMKTQSVERTFADKLYAAADYYLDNMADRDSRHLYDLYCMAPYIRLDSNFIDFLKEVRDVRRTQPNNPAAQSEKPVMDILQEAIDTDFYQHDYNKYTMPLLFKAVSYDAVKKNLIDIIAQLRRLAYEDESYCLGKQNQKCFT